MKEAFEFSKKGCELGHMASCHNLSLMYDKGEGVKQDLEKAKEYKQLADKMMELLKAQTIEAEEKARQQGLSLS